MRLCVLLNNKHFTNWIASQPGRLHVAWYSVIQNEFTHHMQSHSTWATNNFIASISLKQSHLLLEMHSDTRLLVLSRSVRHLMQSIHQGQNKNEQYKRHKERGGCLKCIAVFILWCIPRICSSEGWPLEREKKGRRKCAFTEVERHCANEVLLFPQDVLACQINGLRMRGQRNSPLRSFLPPTSSLPFCLHCF